MSAAFEGVDELGQPSSPGCDVIGLQMRPPEDAADVLRHSLSLASKLDPDNKVKLVFGYEPDMEPDVLARGPFTTVLSRGPVLYTRGIVFYMRSLQKVQPYLMSTILLLILYYDLGLESCRIKRCQLSWFMHLTRMPPNAAFSRHVLMEEDQGRTGTRSFS